jgi:hypothetical protein
MADFIFRVDSVHLTNEQQDKIASAIQGAVLTELAKLDLHGESKGKASAPAAAGSSGAGFLYIPITWLGGRMIRAEGVANALGNTLAVAERAEQSKAA